MPTVTLEIPQPIFERMSRLVTRRGEVLEQFAAAALIRMVNEEESTAAPLQESDKAIQAALHVPARSAKESDLAFRNRHSIPDLSHLTEEEIADQADAICR